MRLTARLTSHIGVLICTALLGGCAGYRQTTTQVFSRRPGHSLEYWMETSEASKLHWPYAWAAAAAYQDALDHRETLATGCAPAEDILKNGGWIRWPEIPQLDDMSTNGLKMAQAHLRVQVWSKESERRVIVAFGGTANSLDWRSNLRWFLPSSKYKDQYVVLTDVFVPVFLDAYRKHIAEQGEDWLKSAKVVATGHSLGGGLAQRFAYSLSPQDGVPKVGEVYAFDPSPVSGKRDLPNWKELAKDLHIYRIYERAEILADIRFLLMLYEAPPESEGQTWTDIRYMDDTWGWRAYLPWGAVHAHSMDRLACFMSRNASGDETSSSTALGAP